jgi:hypothetical protein
MYYPSAVKEGEMTRGAGWKLVVAAAGALALGSGSASAAQTVGPNQVFTGVVNGSTSNATVQVVCPGPTRPGELGRPFNDSWEVVEGTGAGFTGSAATSIVATIGPGPNPPGSAASSATFTQYGVPQTFPPTLLVPCSGTGVAVFRPMPTSPTARSSTVTVRFLNVAV